MYALHADDYNRRLFSGSGDNSVAVWYYDKLQDTMLQIQQLKSVSKSTKFTCITTAKNINCLIAGGDNGFITIWHEYDLNCDELSDKMYDLRMLIKKREKEVKEERKKLLEERKEREEIDDFDDDLINEVIKDEVDGEEKEQKYNPDITDGNVLISPKVDVSDKVPPSLTQHREILKQNERRYDISKNNLKNGSISSKKSKSNMVWKCVYTWKAHKGSVTTVSYYEDYNMLMSTSNSGQIRLVYLCDPGKVPPMEMVKPPSDNVVFPDFIKDKLNKIFNEIQEIETNNYPNTQYQNLNLMEEYQHNEAMDDTPNDKKEEEEPEEEIVIDHEKLEKYNAVADDIWNDGNDEINNRDNVLLENEFNANVNVNKSKKESDNAFLDEISKYDDTPLDDLL